jgi:hypothetical protein
VAIVMADNRDPRSPKAPPYLRWSLVGNLRYASAHAYDLLYYRLLAGDGKGEGDGVCVHPVLGERAAPWCKIAAALEALERGASTFYPTWRRCMQL